MNIDNQQKTSKNPIKVLIVEDELIVAENIANNLRKQGYEVVGIVESGEEAVQIALTTRPNVLLMDIMLQGEIDGITAAGKIRTQINCPIIYMTAYADDDTIKRAKITEPYGYLVKPFKPKDIKTAIEMALQKHQAETSRQAQYIAQIQLREDKLNQLINKDSLTNLPNKKYLEKQFAQIVKEISNIEQKRSEKDNQTLLIPVFCISLDRLERINKFLGNDGGDRMIQALAKRLTTQIGINAIIARNNVNEFLVVWHPLKYLFQTRAVARNLLQIIISQPFLIDNQEIFISASIGAAIYPHHGGEIEQLLTNSREIKNHLQEKGGNSWGFYNPGNKANFVNELALETDLHYAIKRQELQLHYQPKVDLCTGKIVGAEALLRWYHPQRGLISPDNFIPLAEETGLIEPIGEWVLKTACQQIINWQKEGLKPIKLAINLSPCQLRQVQLHLQFSQILIDFNLHPEQIQLELTESMLDEDINMTNRRLTSLKALGFELAMDDFGKGYSSLSNLHQFPFDILKIDRSLIQGINTSPKNTAIVQSMIVMAHQLNLKVVAEGVSSQSELKFLRENNCDEIQGYIFSPAIPSDQFAELIRMDKSLVLV